VNADDDDHAETHRALIEANARAWNSFWYWREKPIGEHGAAKEILRHAGIKAGGLVSRPPNQDPPDCEGMLDRQWSAVEIAELVHRPTLKRSIKAQAQRAAGCKPQKPEAYFVWDRNDLIDAIQKRIDVKDKAKLRGGPYDRYVLVMHTNELILDSRRVGEFLKGAKFHCQQITDVILGLSYEPQFGREGYPTFRLELTRSRLAL
jgi:hypothetical protein